jgi:prephenate dehydrogenase
MFTMKLDIIKEIFTNNPRLYAEIIALSPHTNQVIERYGRILSDIETLTKQGDAEALTALMEKRSLWPA